MIEFYTRKTSNTRNICSDANFSSGYALWMETIHDRIKRLRIAKGLSMAQLAEKAKVNSWQTVQQWENKTAPKRTRTKLVADALGVSENYLLTGQDSQSPGLNVFVDKKKNDAQIDEVVALMKSMSDIGKAMLLERARMLAEMHPLNKQKTSFQ